MKILIDFEIQGVGTKTGRKRKKIYSVFSKEEAIQKALADGTTPEEIIELPQEPATQKQIDFANDLGIIIPNEPSLRMMSVLISEAIERKNEVKNKPLKTRKPVVASSGFQFPVFPYTEETLVRITDLTDYRNDFLEMAYDKKSYCQEDFDNDLDPNALDIEVEEFDIMLKPSTLKKLGVKKPPAGWLPFHEEVRWMKEEQAALQWPMTKSIHHQLVKIGLLKQLPETNETQSLYFESLTVKELREICGKHSIKKSGSKTELIERIIANGTPKAKPSCGLTSKYDNQIMQLAKLYLSDIKKQLQDKPAAYHVLVWEQVSEENGIGGQLPDKARLWVSNKFESIKPVDW
ncbi:MAG: SAP domain-containing protein [Candidatus Electrothrix sp. YB6]